MKAWDVYKPMPGTNKDRELDTVFYDDNCTAEYVRDGLINHDGYHPSIYVVCEKTGERAGE